MRPLLAFTVALLLVAAPPAAAAERGIVIAEEPSTVALTLTDRRGTVLAEHRSGSPRPAARGNRTTLTRRARAL